jgi:multiple antibiotic resistance protein
MPQELAGLSLKSLWSGRFVYNPSDGILVEYMPQLLKDFTLVFLPLLVAMDPLATLPFLVPFLSSLQPGRRVRVINIAAVTGLAIGLLFLGLGRAIFSVLGITVADFVIAGGLILLIISLKELVSSTTGEALPAPNELVAVVPIGTPLLVGPATISLLIVLSGLFSVWLVVVAFLANVLLAWAVFTQARHITRFLGQGGLQAFSKVAYLLLAAIAVQLIRGGLTEILQGKG